LALSIHPTHRRPGPPKRGLCVCAREPLVRGVCGLGSAITTDIGLPGPSHHPRRRRYRSTGHCGHWAAYGQTIPWSHECRSSFATRGRWRHRGLWGGLASLSNGSVVQASVSNGLKSPVFDCPDSIVSNLTLYPLENDALLPRLNPL
jgi:hypothetical protein